MALNFIAQTMVQGVASGSGDGYGSFTWFKAIPFFRNLDHSISSSLPNTLWQGVEVQTVTHIFLSLLMATVVMFLALRAGAKLKDPERAVVPEAKLNARNFFEVVFDAAMGSMVDSMGEKYAKRVLPLVGTVICYVFFSNILGLIPGFAPPTDNLNVTLAPALIVFVATHYYGLREHGLVGYIKHFMGPVALIAPLYFAIEIVGHLSRVLSLSFRLMGNMIGDHAVLAAFLGLTSVSFIFPVPVWALGLVVCTVQTLVFALLTIVYIQLAVAHDDH